MKPLVLPTEIPWTEMRGEVLEQFVYWLLDEMGAKDLEWRKGGKRATSADGGRDLEATFYMATPDGEMRKEKWWIQLKGRSNTVEAAAVKEFIVTAEAFSDLGVLVVATNTQFSNPTRDWVKDWQKKRSSPLVRLWDKDSLERLALQHPSTVARNYPKALSPQGNLQALTTRFWNQFHFPNDSLLEELWNTCNSLELSSEAVISLVAGETNANSYGNRPWLTKIDNESLFEVIALLVSNFLYLVMRMKQLGVQEEVVMKTTSLIISSGLARLSITEMSEIVLAPFSLRDVSNVPGEISNTVISWLLNSVKQSLQPSCVSDCTRISSDPAENEGFDLLKSLKGLPAIQTRQSRQVIIEGLHDPCRAGLALSEQRRCPLFGGESAGFNQRLIDYAEIIRNRIGQV